MIVRSTLYFVLCLTIFHFILYLSIVPKHGEWKRFPESNPSPSLKSKGAPSWFSFEIIATFRLRSYSTASDRVRWDAGNLKGVRDSIYTPRGRHFRPLTELLARPLAPRFRNPVLSSLMKYIHNDFPERRGCGDTRINRVAKWTEGREGRGLVTRRRPKEDWRTMR